MDIKNYVRQGLTTLILAGSLFFNGCIHLQSYKPQRLEQRILYENKVLYKSAEPNEKQDKYAVLISGNTENRHRINLYLTYKILLENDFQRDNIYILDNEGKKVSPYPVDESARRESIIRIFDHLRKKIDDQDLLFVYMTDHGERTLRTFNRDYGKEIAKLSTLVIPGYDLDQREFSECLQGINPQTGIFLFEQCYSGGFAEEIGKGNYLAIASTKSRNTSSSGINDSFGRYFMLAFRNRQNSDLNSDGKISIGEAFEYAKNQHSWSKKGKQKPFIQGEIDANEIFLK